MMSQGQYERAIRKKLADLTRLAESEVTLARVIQVLKPLEAYCERERCMGAETCSHVRIDVLWTGKRMGGAEESPYTARFKPGDDPGEPVILSGWLE